MAKPKPILLASTKSSDYCIATMGSHSALQILKGARDEGMRNLVICKKGTERPYISYGVADEIITVKDWSEWNDKLEEELIRRNAVVIPHGSFIAYLGTDRVMKMQAMYYGTKEILKWESDRSLERKWLEKSGLELPHLFAKPEDIDRPAIVKFHGASGGFGYFIAKSAEQFYEVKNRKYPEQNEYALQEYIVGVPLYVHYFYSPLTKELEIMSFDKRYESNADSIGRIRAEDQLSANIHTSYTIVGNIPVVVRESMLPQFFAMGERVVEQSRTLGAGKGLFGPFCLECIVTRKLQVFVFEISARIVAGTNPFVEGSPYTQLRYKEPMSTGRRIARDIKQAIEQGRLDEVLG
ncbi:MAG TPA: 5-formaminoimidazole-4-carboxamide-1-(beta)-D-ribofuranosyl 5'-monophosphate synthetase [Candidatus Peribacter riflensis]|uniref:5-formaminoimidazole-4-carboxamide-1-(Beta)-D-ribofuranosy l 5'-monophosphate synthetase n=1 Tax=Candidatus Peribacter riflensis TaxID=1735162 RepID=A0A0S1SHD2_9BACT|nr:MAG: phosphoribosylaminoimidazolecarboxamide formyltransferase [Candidatus Peribacter riflensis]OGJ77780.1 MAG: 5-formaminoimidazole-4-carboxamide-1-(beta)-D-ribofuranosyl 5'-monophosphate synthetase [Candidatus Peribacteria bacterium RIFOXYB1_FULL_57_12]OGJ80415.1 MAG: 5-formaminoimidazole-4-carboxamide-1-(beta)-D-ribofuranosyl 5'-monophosphate synthetase [Candidatus Peribacteria bacterium RIFOXYC1_FULL_58_8]ALM11194.1 MAG: phosphoribosylaminoimidazolecarboxamide formyltransferase [Candidatu